MLVSGWAIDYDIAGPVTVQVYVDGTVRQAWAASQLRTDVGVALPGTGDRHCFRLVAVAAGTHNVCVLALNQGHGTNRFLACKNVSVAFDPMGSLEFTFPLSENGVAVWGWAIDPDVAGPVTVYVYADGVFIGATAANKSRIDVAAVIPGYGPDHGFEAFLAGVPAGAPASAPSPSTRPPGPTSSSAACAGDRDVGAAHRHPGRFWPSLRCDWSPPAAATDRPSLGFVGAAPHAEGLVGGQGVLQALFPHGAAEADRLGRLGVLHRLLAQLAGGEEQVGVDASAERVLPPAVRVVEAGRRTGSNPETGTSGFCCHHDLPAQASLCMHSQCTPM